MEVIRTDEYPQPTSTYLPGQSGRINQTAIMSGLDLKSSNPDDYPRPREDEEVLNLDRDWTAEEEAKAKRKYVDRQTSFLRNEDSQLPAQVGLHNHASPHTRILLLA